MSAREIVQKIEGHGAGLRVRDGRLQIARTDRLPAYLVDAAREAESELVAFLEERKRQRQADRARIERENAAARHDAERELLPPAKRLS